MVDPILNLISLAKTAKNNFFVWIFSIFFAWFAAQKSGFFQFFSQLFGKILRHESCSTVPKKYESGFSAGSQASSGGSRFRIIWGPPYYPMGHFLARYRKQWYSIGLIVCFYEFTDNFYTEIERLIFLTKRRRFILWNKIYEL